MDFDTLYNMKSMSSPHISLDSGLDSVGSSVRTTHGKDGEGDCSPPTKLVSRSAHDRKPKRAALFTPSSLRPISYTKGRHSPCTTTSRSAPTERSNWRRFLMHDEVAFPLEELRMAVVQGNVAVVEALIGQGTAVDQTLRSGWTALMFASSCAKHEVVRFLLQQGADPNMHKEMFTALIAACASSYEDEASLLICVNLLLDFGAKPDAYERHRMTALMFACKEGRVDIVARLIEARVDVNRQDNKGWSALCWAAVKGHGRVARILLDAKADPCKMNIHGQRPADIAMGSGHLQLADILERAAMSGTSEPVVGLTEPPESSTKKHKTLKPQVFPAFHYGEMEMVLSGLDLADLIPLFQANKISLECFLRLNEADLEKLGIEAVGTRKTLLQAIALIHKQEWKSTSLPNLAGFPYITLPDAVAMVSNINKHLQFIHASVGHLRDQIQATPRILQLGQEKHTVSTLSSSFSDSLKNLFCLCEEVKFFKAHLDRVCDNAEYTSADLIVIRKDDGCQWQRRLLASLVAATSVITVVYFFRPKTFSWLFSLTPYPQRSAFVDFS